MDSNEIKKFLRYDQLKKYSEGVKDYIDDKDNSLKEELFEKIIAEETSRKIEDGTLNANIEELKGQLTAETNLRQQNDTTLSNSIEKINQSIEALEKSDDEILENVSASAESVKLELLSKLNEESANRENAIQNLKTTVTESVKVDGNALIRDDAGNISLNEDYIKYLNNAIYEANKPAITVFNFKNGIKASEEIGKSIVVNGFEHKESNIFNIEGTLTLRKNSRNGSILVEDIAKSNSIADISFTEEVTSDTLYYLIMTTTTYETIIKSLDISFYAPAFVVASTSDSLSQDQIVGVVDTDILSRQRLSTSYIGKGELNLTSNGYIYFVTTDNIKNIIDSDTGFGFGYSSMGQMALDINGINKNYNIYRSFNLIPGTYKFTVS